MRENFRVGVVTRLGLLAIVLFPTARALGLVATDFRLHRGRLKLLDRVLAGVCAFSASGAPSLALAALPHPSRNAEDQMEVVYGTIREILPEIEGMARGFVIDGGLEVNFAKDVAQRVSGVVTLGSRLEICGQPFRGRSGEPRMDAEFITNLDSNRSISLHVSPPMDKPEAPSSSSPTPVKVAPLVPPRPIQTGPRNPAVVASRKSRHRPSPVTKIPN